MLAKVWKKALLAVCIICCLYNVTHKLISRVPLETQLKSVENQTSLIDPFQKENTEKSQVDSNEKEKEENKVKTNTVNQQVSTDDNTIVIIN